MTYTVTVREALTLNSQDTVLPLGGVVTDAKIATVAGVYGTATYTASGLPSFVSFNSSAATISGTVPQDQIDKAFNVTVAVTDSLDGVTISTNMIISVKTAYLFFRIADPNPRVYGNSVTGYSGGFYQASFYEGGVNVTGLLINGKLPTMGLDPQPSIVSKNNNDTLHVARDADGLFWKGYKFMRPVAISSVSINNYLKWQASNSSFVKPRFEGSNDGVTWVTLWEHPSTWGTQIAQSSTRP